MDESFTIDEFCRAEKISRSFFYVLEKRNDAPATYKVGKNRRISKAACDAWRTAREAVSA
jgi:hypothetical protein